jgi:hypothetical protein
MNDLSMPVRSTDRSEQEILNVAIDPGAHISTLDRLSLRLGLWLLLRSSRRIRRMRDSAEYARVLAHRQAEQERERTAAWMHFDRWSHL